MLIEIVLCALVGGVILYEFVKISSSRQNIPLEGKIVFVTGCDTGFGNALARKLDSLGCTVFAGCLNAADEGAEALRKESSARLKIVQLDVTKDESVEEARKEVQNHLRNSSSQLWAVVNNAGIIVQGHIEICSMEVFHKVAEVNLFGTIRVTKAFLPFIRRAKGRVINVSSVNGRYYSTTRACYNVSKHGVESFSDVLRLEMRKFGVRISVIEPGKYWLATGIGCGKAKEERLRAIDRMWQEAGDEVKTTYKESYQSFRRHVAGEDLSGKSGLTPEPVIKAFLDALCSPYPRKRYLVQGGTQVIDSHCFLAAVSAFLPTLWMDRLTMYINPEPA